MGACDFTTIGRGKTAKEAFDNAVHQAAYDYGHAGYTGTIAEKCEFVMIIRTPMETSEACKLADDLIGDGDPRIDDKWGPAGCIPLTEEDKFLFFGWASS